MKRHPLIMFFVLAFALPWAVWSTTLAEQAGWLAWHLPSSLAFWIALPIATFGTAAYTGGWPAVRDLIVRMIRVRVRVQWWIVALLLTPLTAGVVLLLTIPLGPEIGVALPTSALIGVFLLDSWMFLLSEEPAWRGFALPRLEQRMSRLVAAIVLGALWALWHIPLFFVDGSFQQSVPFLGFAISAIATSVTISGLFHRARGSVLIAAIFHAATDVTIAWTGVMTSGPAIFWIFVAAQTAVAAVAGVTLARMPSGADAAADAVVASTHSAT